MKSPDLRNAIKLKLILIYKDTATFLYPEYETSERQWQILREMIQELKSELETLGYKVKA